MTAGGATDSESHPEMLSPKAALVSVNSASLPDFANGTQGSNSQVAFAADRHKSSGVPPIIEEEVSLNGGPSIH